MWTLFRFPEDVFDFLFQTKSWLFIRNRCSIKLKINATNFPVDRIHNKRIANNQIYNINARQAAKVFASCIKIQIEFISLSRIFLSNKDHFLIGFFIVKTNKCLMCVKKFFVQFILKLKLQYKTMAFIHFSYGRQGRWEAQPVEYENI